MKKNFVINTIIKTIILVVFSSVITNSALAKNEEIKPFIKGSFEQIQQENKDTPYIITFWSETCAYCMKELALFGELLKTYPSVKIVSISTDPFLEEGSVNRILSSKNLQHIQKWVFADNYAERLYFDVDPKWRGELPLTYFIDRDNKMLKKLGTINKQKITGWFSTQNNAALK